MYKYKCVLKVVCLQLFTIVFFASPAGAGGPYRRDELRLVFHQLNFIEAQNCLTILKTSGYDVGTPQFPVEREKLPMIFELPDSQNISVVGASALDKTGDGSPQQRIGILFHEDQRREYGELIRFLNEQIDVQANQVQIEAMVVELTESGTRELGLEYDWQKGDDVSEARRERHAIFGEDGLDLSILRFTERGTPEFFRAQLRALIEDRTAEVLSSPSVLTLDNRHARIEIMREVPIIEKSGGITADRWDVNVRFEQVGIILNIKPRVDSTGEWVTLQVQVEVSEALDYLETPGGDKIAPEIERRKVETISRIRNNHPFIVGGLMRDDATTTEKKVPLLGYIPIMGRLFRFSATTQEKREVIIVLTPRVIRATASDRPLMPKDGDRFDFFDTRLFRETYTLKAEDVYDLAFILDRPEIKRILGMAGEYIDINPEVAERPPFSAVAGGAIPGEEAIVNRMLYNVVRKLNLFRQIDGNRLIYFTPDEDDPSGFSVAWLSRKLEELAGERSVEEHLDADFPKRVLYVSFEMPDHGGADTKTNYPIATTEIRHVRSATEAERRLYELGRLDGMTRPNIAFMISNKRDIERLKASIVVREILEVNDPKAIQRLSNFTVGRRIAIPEIDPAEQRTFLIDRGAAKPFYMSNFYYAEFQETLQIYLNEIKERLGEKEENWTD